MAWKWYVWVGLISIIFGLYLIGKSDNNLGMALIVWIVGGIIFFVGKSKEPKTEKGRKDSEKGRKIMKIAFYIVGAVVLFFVLAFLYGFIFGFG